MFVPHHRLEAAPGAEPDRWALFVHGVFGQGVNWRGFARRLVRERPGWGAVLVDLRLHGASRDALPPHGIAAAAEDLVALQDALGLDARPIRSVVGHSLGGKVALRLIERGELDLEHAWVLDTLIDARPDAFTASPRPEAVAVLDLLAQLPRLFESSDAFVDRLAASGTSRGVAQWLAMNLRSTPAGMVLGLDLEAMRLLLEDHFALDSWPALLAAECPVHVVLGGRSTVVAAEARARLRALAAERPGRVAVHELEGAGHWLHVDAPDALLDLLLSVF